jgi:hypothetical protein
MVPNSGPSRGGAGRALSAQLRHPPPRSAMAGLRRFETSLKRLKCPKTGHCPRVRRMGQSTRYCLPGWYPYGRNGHMSSHSVIWADRGCVGLGRQPEGRNERESEAHCDPGCRRVRQSNAVRSCTTAIAPPAMVRRARATGRRAKASTRLGATSSGSHRCRWLSGIRSCTGPWLRAGRNSASRCPHSRIAVEGRHLGGRRLHPSPDAAKGQIG